MGNQYENKTVTINCPECKHEFDQEVEVTIYHREPDIEVVAK